MYILLQEKIGKTICQTNKEKWKLRLESYLKMNRRETKADTLKATEANRKRGTGTREKVRSKRINLEGNTHAQEINVSQCPV
jgi:hypothetical protein